LDISTLPIELVTTKIYKYKDFRNSFGIIPTYWNKAAMKVSMLDNATDTTTTVHNISSIANNSDLNDYDYDIYGPCYNSKTKIKWNKIINRTNEHNINYPIQSNHDDLHGLCRPGFLIIGFGKCGTSSLYHYLIGHPRVLPAKKKQVHYFNNFPKEPMSKYLSFFPSTSSFLSSGALMTGEAAPGKFIKGLHTNSYFCKGYIPYPAVARRIYNRMYMKGGAPRFILLVREPLQRAYSSYKYSYLYPALKLLKKKHRLLPSVTRDIGLKQIEYHEDNDFYEEYLFSFEDFIISELRILKQCLEENSYAMNHSYTVHSFWVEEEYSKREKEGLPPLIDIDRFCYNNEKDQWGDMKEKHPHRILYSLPNKHLLKQFIGRSLYTLFLEWWYATFPKDNIHIICSEDLRTKPNPVMNNLTAWLGLPKYNYSNVVSEGMYNVYGKQGYDSVTKWKDVDESSVYDDESVPLGEELKGEVLGFFEGFNRRMFELTGVHCHW